MADAKGIDWILGNMKDEIVERGEWHGQPFVTVKPGAIRAVAKAFRDDLGFAMLEDLTAVDYLDRPEVAGRFRVVYHFLCLARRELVRVKTVADGSDPEVPSIAGIYPGADWLEREVYDMFGIRFTDHPDLRRILMAPDWEGFPCRRDYPWQGHIPIHDPMREKDFARGVPGEHKE
ncbi:MAG: NADH-quinone oxidoreductase subunit C [Planctomycetes bacterium]|jgi:NADH-quinone oxidoreductase subunit C|nr:NADH-quinone oxidoreductase subunit C [Planctomycetota bacterium]